MESCTQRNKILIVGGPGSGKTYLSKKIKQHLRLPVFSSDNFFWKEGSLENKRPKQEREKMLRELLSKKKWVLEGVFFSWIKPAVAEAEIIIFLDVHPIIRAKNIIIRFIRQPNREGRKEKLINVLRLLKDNFFLDINNKQLVNKETFVFTSADKAIEEIIKMRH